MTRTMVELTELLETQLGHLGRSLDAFNSGIWAEAERLAATAYILLADGKGRTQRKRGLKTASVMRRACPGLDALASSMA